jgi:hypothetical protein
MFDPELRASLDSAVTAAEAPHSVAFTGPCPRARSCTDPGPG